MSVSRRDFLKSAIIAAGYVLVPGAIVGQASSPKLLITEQEMARLIFKEVFAGRGTNVMGEYMKRMLREKGFTEGQKVRIRLQESPVIMQSQWIVEGV